MIVDYTPLMKISNTDQLPGGTGARYLEAIGPVAGPFIACQWRRFATLSLPAGRVLIRFGAKRRD